VAITPLPCLYPIESYKDSAITLGDPPRLHLPLKITVNDVFQIQIDQQEQTDYELIVVRALFKIKALYLSLTDYKSEMSFQIGSSFAADSIVSHRGHLQYSWEIKLIKVLNQTQYLLSIPLEEIPLHLEEEGIMKDLVMWRLDLPRDYGCTNPIGTFFCNI